MEFLFKKITAVQTNKNEGVVMSGESDISTMLRVVTLTKEDFRTLVKLLKNFKGEMSSSLKGQFSNAKTNGWEPLCFYLVDGSQDIGSIDLFYKVLGKDFFCVKDKSDNTIWHKAAKEADLNILKSLNKLEGISDLRTRGNRFGVTPYDLAEERQNISQEFLDLLK